MTKEEIERRVRPFIQTAIAGGEIENPKVDFKKTWYLLSEPTQISEFINDVCSIVNTLGLDGYIVIGLGLNPLSFENSNFKASGLRDESDLMKLIGKNADPIFTVNSFEILYEDHKLTVLHIPPSTSMPHIVKHYNKGDCQYQNTIWTRKGTSKYRANRNDIELMYHYRESIKPEYLIQCSFNVSTLSLRSFGPHTAIRSTWEFINEVVIDFENSGRRPVSIISIEILLSHSEKITAETVVIKMNFDKSDDPIVVQPGKLISRKITAVTHIGVEEPDTNKVRNHRNQFNETKQLLIEFPVSLTFSNGKKYLAPLSISGINKNPG